MKKNRNAILWIIHMSVLFVTYLLHLQQELASHAIYVLLQYFSLCPSLSAIGLNWFIFFVVLLACERSVAHRFFNNNCGCIRSWLTVCSSRLRLPFSLSSNAWSRTSYWSCECKVLWCSVVAGLTHCLPCGTDVFICCVHLQACLCAARLYTKSVGTKLRDENSVCEQHNIFCWNEVQRSYIPFCLLKRPFRARAWKRSLFDPFHLLPHALVGLLYSLCTYLPTYLPTCWPTGVE